MKTKTFMFRLTDEHITKICQYDPNNHCPFLVIDEGGAGCLGFSHIQQEDEYGNCTAKLDLIFEKKSLLFGKEFILKEKKDSQEQRGVLSDLVLREGSLFFYLKTSDHFISMPVKYLIISVGNRVINFTQQKGRKPYSLMIVVDPYKKH